MQETLVWFLGQEDPHGEGKGYPLQYFGLENSMDYTVHGVAKSWTWLSDFPEKAMAPHSSTLAWKIPWMEEPGRLQSMGSLELDTTEWLPFHFSLSCIGEGNGKPLQCSCLENPRDGGAWWAAVYGVAQSWTRLKRLSSSSSSKWLSLSLSWYNIGFPGGASGKESTYQHRSWVVRDAVSMDPWVRKVPWRMPWQPSSVFLPGESHGQRSLVGYSP